jgi:hypothetical protein
MDHRRTRLPLPRKAMGVVARTLLALLIGLGVPMGCHRWRSDVVHVSVKFITQELAAFMENVNVIVGSDKFWWPRLAAGEQDEVTLKPRPEDDRQLTLLFTLKGDRRSWDGPKFGPGDGYRLAILIDGAGKVVERHCTLPCRLD